MTHTVLVVEDDADVLALVQFMLSFDGGWHVITARSVADALTALRSHHIDVVLTDGQLGDGTAEVVLAAADSLPVVLLSAWADGPKSLRIPDSGYAARISKPFDPMALSGVLGEALEQASGATGLGR